MICNPLGKSGGALIQQFMIIGFGSLAASTPYLGLILLAIVGMWIFAAKVRFWLWNLACYSLFLSCCCYTSPAVRRPAIFTWVLLQDLDWRFAAAQEDMAKAAESADGDDSTAAPAAETKPASA